MVGDQGKKENRENVKLIQCIDARCDQMPLFQRQFETIGILLTLLLYSWWCVKCQHSTKKLSRALKRYFTKLFDFPLPSSIRMFKISSRVGSILLLVFLACKKKSLFKQELFICRRFVRLLLIRRQLCNDECENRFDDFDPPSPSAFQNAVF